MGNSEEHHTAAIDIYPCTKLKNIKAFEFFNLVRTTKRKVLFVYFSKLDLQQSNPCKCLILPSHT